MTNGEQNAAPKKSTKLSRFINGVAVAVVTAFLVIRFGERLIELGGNRSDEANQALLQHAENQPLIRLVVKDNPPVDAQFRAAIAAEERNPTESGPNRILRVGDEVRKKYIVPALANADDRHALTAIKVLQELTTYLQKTSPATCFEFGRAGLQRPEQFDGEWAWLCYSALVAQEDAYLNGKSATSTRPQPDRAELTRVLIEAGYTDADFQQLAAYAALSEADGCAATVKLYSTPARLPPERGAVVARYLLTVAQ